MASSPAEISKYEQNNVNISPRDRSVEFNTDGGPRNVGDLLSTNDDEDEVADDEEEVAEGVSQLWERRITRMIADNGITRVDLRRLRLEAFPMDLLQEAKLVSTEFESMDESLASSSSMLESRLQKGVLVCHYGFTLANSSFLAYAPQERYLEDELRSECAQLRSLRFLILDTTAYHVCQTIYLGSLS